MNYLWKIAGLVRYWPGYMKFLSGFCIFVLLNTLFSGFWSEMVENTIDQLRTSLREFQNDYIPWFGLFSHFYSILFHWCVTFSLFCVRLRPFRPLLRWLWWNWWLSSLLLVWTWLICQLRPFYTRFTFQGTFWYIFQPKSETKLALTLSIRLWLRL